MNTYPSWNTDFSLPKRALFVSTQSLPAFVEETEALLEDTYKPLNLKRPAVHRPLVSMTGSKP